ncbi:MAG: hypothetical protein AAF541_24055 [Pseudomonadota bacterium]
MNNSTTGIRGCTTICCLVLIATIAPGAVAAPNFAAGECAEIRDDRQRLDCYDAVFAKPGDQVTDKGASDPLGSTLNAVNKQISQRDAPLPTREVDVSARVVDIHKNLRNELLVELDNGQLWKQTSPRFLDIGRGEEVIIKQARLGGYILSTAGGSSTRVKHIE